MAPNRDPEVVTYRIPQIEVYQVTSDELQRIEDGCSHVGQDLTFAVASLSVFASFLVALLTAIVLRQPHKRNFRQHRNYFRRCAAIYTGWRWCHLKASARATPETIT